MNRREMLMGLVGLGQLPTVKIIAKVVDTGYCPACGEKAKTWEPDKPCKYTQQVIMMNDNAFIYNPWPGKVINPDLAACDSVDMFTGTRDWRRHICHNCKNIYAIPKGLANGTK